MKKKRDDDWDELRERGRAARREMQATIDRVDARIAERRRRQERGFFRRLFAR
jgi:hypothetical protein